MHSEELFLQAFVFLAAAVVAVPVAKKLGLGSVLGYLAAGIAIGPFGLGLVGEEIEDVLGFAEFGVVMMLFVIGLELEPSRLWKLRTPILGLGGLQVVASATAIAGIATLLGLAWRSALAVGLILALSSTAIVLQTLAEKGMMKTSAGQSSFAVLLFQDIAVIPMLALLPLLAAPGHGAGGGAVAEDAHHTTWTEGLAPWAETLVVLGAVAAVIVAGRFLVNPGFRVIARTRLRELFTAAALFLVIGIALLMTRVGLSPALGTFLAGVVLANSEYRHELETDIEPFKGLLLGLFFISVGAAIDFGLVAGAPALIGGLAVALVVVKTAILLALARIFRLGTDQSILFALALAQGGEFAFVLTNFATQHGVLGRSVAGPLIAVVAISMALTPLLLLLGEKVLLPRVGTLEKVERPADEVPGERPVIIAGFGRFGHVVGRLLRANGVESTVLDLDSDQVDLLRRFGLEVFYGDATRVDLLRAAGAEHASVMVIALDDPKKTRELVKTAKEHFPRLRLLVRAVRRADAYELFEMGVEQVYRETLDSSLRMGADALQALGFRAYQARRSARTFRRHDEAALRDLAKHRHDEKRYVNLVRQRIANLEAILRADLEGPSEEVGAGWDAQSLRREFGGRPDEVAAGGEAGNGGE